MNEKAIVKPNEPTKHKQAHEIYTQILEAKHHVATNIIRLGLLLTFVQEKKIYEFLDCDTFEEFIAMPELGFKRTTAYLFMNIYRHYIREWKCDPELIATIDISKLQIINPIIKKHPDELNMWLGEATFLSRGDLINKVREKEGKPPMQIKAADIKAEENLMKYDDYLKFVKSQPCCICKTKNTGAPHHFPTTVGAGASHWKVIPICNKCHVEYHADPLDFTWKYITQITDYFYGVVAMAFKFLNEFTKK